MPSHCRAVHVLDAPESCQQPTPWSMVPQGLVERYPEIGQRRFFISGTHRVSSRH